MKPPPLQSNLAVGADSLVTVWADDLYLHGVHLGRWIVDYVDLEESLAVGTLAQEQLAHARELLTASGLDAAAVDQRLFDRPVESWTPSRLAADPIRAWPQVVVVGLLLSHATLAVLREIDDPPQRLAGVVPGIVAEQRLHLLHWQRWIVLLGRSGATRAALVTALQWAGDLAGDLLGDLASDRTDDLAEPASSGALPWLGQTRQRFATELAASLTAADLPTWSFDVSEPRRAGEHAWLIAPVLTEQSSVRTRYPDPVLQP